MIDLETPVEIIKTEDGYELHDLNDLCLGVFSNKEIVETVKHKIDMFEHLHMHNEALKKRVEELEASEDNLIKERDRAELYADRLSQAISNFFMADIGGHSNMNNPWDIAIEIISTSAKNAQVEDSLK